MTLNPAHLCPFQGCKVSVALTPAWLRSELQVMEGPPPRDRPSCEPLSPDLISLPEAQDSAVENQSHLGPGGAWGHTDPALFYSIHKLGVQESMGPRPWCGPLWRS